MTRTFFAVFAALLWMLLLTPRIARATIELPPVSDCSLIGASERSSGGNEDIFVFLDSSLSMGPTSFGPWATGYMEPARRLLLDLVDCYLRDGDFLLVATFDSEARVEIAKDIGSAREKTILRHQLAGLGPSRARYFRRLRSGKPVEEAMPPRPGELPAGRILGGSWKTDLGEMLSLAKDLLGDYAEPQNRQVILFFTDGEHDPPEYTAFRSEVSLDLFLDREDLETQSLQIGIVAIPRSPGDEANSERLAEMFARLDPQRIYEGTGQMGLIQPEDENPAESFIAQLADFLRLRIVLDAPRSLSLGQQVRPKLDVAFPVRNETRVDRSVELTEVYFRDQEGRRHALEVSPTRLDLAAGEGQTLRVWGSLDPLPLGRVDGILQFEFGSAVVFHPQQVEVEGVHLGWMERYGWILQVAGVSMALLALAGVRWWRRPRWIAVAWTDGRAVHVSLPKQIAISQSLKVGASGIASLAVAGPESRLGEVTRVAVEGYKFEFDPLYLDVSNTEAYDLKSIHWGVWYPVPGSETEKISFRCQRTRQKLVKVLNRIRRSGESSKDPGGSGSWGSSESKHGSDWSF